MKTQLSQDLPIDMIDILWGDEEVATTEEETTTEETTNETTETTETPETKVEEPEVDTTVDEKEVDTETAGEEEFSLESILGDNKEIKEDIDTAKEETEEIKETIEDAKDALENEDTDEAGKLIDDLYKQVIDYSSKVDTLGTKNEILQAKLIDLTKSNTDYELQIAQTSGKSSDPKMLILNRMYDGAVSGEEFSKDKVISTLEDMFYTLTGKSFDETRVDKVSDSNAEEVTLNNATAPEVEEEQPEDVDLNDITSIF